MFLGLRTFSLYVINNLNSNGLMPYYVHDLILHLSACQVSKVISWDVESSLLANDVLGSLMKVIWPLVSMTTQIINVSNR